MQNFAQMVKTGFLHAENSGKNKTFVQISSECCLKSPLKKCSIVSKNLNLLLVRCRWCKLASLFMQRETF